MKSGQLPGRRVVVVDGCRTPFLRSGTAFADMTAYDLGRSAVAGLLHKTAVDPALVDVLIMGTVIADPDTSNVAREVGLACGLPSSCPAYTVTVACVSANLAFLDAVNTIALGMADVAIAGGTETLSDAPIRVSRTIRKRLMAAQKAKGLLGLLKHMKGVKLRDLAPEVPAIADFSTGLSMGQNGERLAKRLGIIAGGPGRLRPHVAPSGGEGGGRRPFRRPDRSRHGTASHACGEGRQRHPRRFDGGENGISPARLRPDLRDTHRRQQLLPHGRGVGRPAHERGQGARAGHETPRGSGVVRHDGHGPAGRTPSRTGVSPYPRPWTAPA